LPEIQGEEMADSVVALLFSPEGIIQEESGKLIARSSRELYRSASQRIPDLTKKKLDKIVNGETDEKELLFEKIQFLANCFKGIPAEELLPLAVALKYKKDYQTGFPSFPDGCIIWSLSGDKPDNEVYVFYNEQKNSPGEKFQGRNNASYYIMSLNAIEEYHYQFPDNSFEILKYIDNNEE
jgi:hypothetical protein